MFRTATLTLILLIGAGVMLPFANSAHGVRQSAGVYRHHRYHSRAWWRRYRARMRQKRAAALAHRNAMLTLPASLPVAAMMPNTLPVANASAENSVRPSDLRSNASIVLPGEMNLSVVALSRPNPAFLTSREASKMLAGVNFSELRRIVIDKMVVAGGWVTNDYVKDVNGSRVFVVTARTPKDVRSPEKAWTFYFTEMGGRIYSLTTDSPVRDADRMTDEAEHFLNSLRSNSEATNR